jgi:hypothetical protein
MLTTVFFLCQKKTAKWATIILGVSVLLMLLDGIFNFNDSFNSQSNLRNIVQNEVFVKIEEDRSSVFLLVYDSIPDLRTLRDLEVDDEPLADLLRGNDFKIYDRTYSIGNASLPSMSRTFQITDASRLSVPQQQEMCAGNSTTFRIFSHNGYGTCSIQGYQMTGKKMFVDEYWPPFEMSEVNNVSTLIRGVFAGEFQLVEPDYLSYHDFLRNTMSVKQGPWFTSMHVWLPGHSQNSGKLLPNETELYIERMNAALPRIEEDISAILKNKPSAVVIIIGDHGPYLTGDGTALNGYPLEEISELMIRDRFGTLVAIRWPDPERAAKYDKDLLVNQDIFPVVFAYLADSPGPLELMIKAKKAVFKGHTFLDNGVFLPAHQ